MITAHSKEIQALVAAIDDGHLLLPELQRRYVWKGPQVRNLFDSLYRGYPSGQLLIWETDDLPHARQVGIDDLDKPQRHPQLLLDGQQRLTSLSAVMLGKPLVVRDSKRPIDIVFNVFTEQFAVAIPIYSGSAGWISLTKLFTQGSLAILSDLQVGFNDPQAKDIFGRLNQLENIKTYKYNVIVLEKIPYDEVTDIFVRINSGGTQLSSADLALAQISSRWRGVTEVLSKYQWSLWNKHKLWLDSGLLLRTMSLMITGQSRLSQFFRGDHRKIAIDSLEDAWGKAQRGLDHAIDFAINNAKIDRLDMLPTHYVLATLAVFYERFGENVSPAQARDLQRWLYMALIWARYSVSGESALDQDYAALSKEQPINALIQNIEDRVGRRRVTERELQDQRKNSPYMVMSYVLARNNGAEDWFRGVKIGSNQPLELHHIFPKALLSKRYSLRADSRIVDQVANLAFLSKSANGKINASSPADYLPTIADARLRAQYVPLNPDLRTLDRFEDFVLQRRQLLAEGINHLLESLTDAPALWPASEVDQLESRIEGLEHQLRDVVAVQLERAFGEDALDKGIPLDVRRSVESRRAQRLGKNPFEADAFDSISGALQFAQFSDYAKIMRGNWHLFRDWFGAGDSFDMHVKAVTTVRNAFAHNNEIGKADLLTGEAGLVWIEECLGHIAPGDDDVLEDDDEDEMIPV